MQLFQNNSFRKAYKCQNNLDPDQDQYFVGPDLGPNFLQRLSADDKSPLSTSSDQESNTMYTDQTAPGLKRAYENINTLISQPKHMLGVLKRTVSMRDGSFKYPKRMFKLMDYKIFKILRSKILLI